MTDITYITVDDTHQIEVKSNQDYSPQCAAHTDQYGKVTLWHYYGTINKHKHFRTEKASRDFLAWQSSI